MISSHSNLPAVTVVPSGESMTFGELNRQSNRLTAAIRSRGLKEGDRIAFLLANQLEYAVVLSSARDGGFDHLPLNTHSSIEELLALLVQLDPRAVIASNKFADKALLLSGKLDEKVLKVMIGASVPGWESYDEMLEKHSADSVTPSKQPGKLLLLSGGSTGQPKIVVRGTPARKSSAQANAFGVTSKASDVVLIPAPLYHSMPVGWMTSALQARTHVVVMERWNSAQFLHTIQEYRVSLVALVPTMMQRLLELPDSVRQQYDLSSLRLVRHGAAPCPLHVKEAFLAWIPCTWEGYGMAEGFGMCLIGPEDWLRKRGSVGKPIGACRIHIRDEAGNELPSGSVGTVWFERTDGARMIYLGQPEETATCYNEQGEGSAFDSGYVDDEGFLHIVGRSKNMLIIGGVNVFPGRIEEALASHEAVADVCVVGISDKEMGEVPIAIVETNKGGTVGAAELSQKLILHCRTAVGTLASPRRVVFVEQIPRTPTGKVRLKDVQALTQTS